MYRQVNITKEIKMEMKWYDRVTLIRTLYPGWEFAFCLTESLRLSEKHSIESRACIAVPNGFWSVGSQKQRWRSFNPQLSVNLSKVLSFPQTLLGSLNRSGPWNGSEKGWELRSELVLIYNDHYWMEKVFKSGLYWWEPVSSAVSANNGRSGTEILNFQPLHHRKTANNGRLAALPQSLSCPLNSISQFVHRLIQLHKTSQNSLLIPRRCWVHRNLDLIILYYVNQYYLTPSWSSASGNSNLTRKAPSHHHHPSSLRSLIEFWLLSKRESPTFLSLHRSRIFRTPER
jgi:hypothetical protein